MRAVSLLLIGLLSAARSSAAQAPDEVAFRVAAQDPGVLEFDKGEEHFVVLPHAVGKFGSKTASNRTGAGPTPRSVLDVLLNRRQSCSIGYWYCEASAARRPSSAAPMATVSILRTPAVLTAHAQKALTCGYNHCYPVGTVCCNDESYCDAGNNCYKVTGIPQDVCCTDNTCTAYVTDGITVTRTSTTSYTSRTRVTTPTTMPPTTTTTTSSPTPTPTVYETYYFTITWYYYSYYWSRFGSTLSVVTSEQTSDRTVIILSATDSEDAYATFSSVSSTLYLPTPEAATTLKSLVGSTSTQPVQTLPRGDDPSTAPSTRSTLTKPTTATKSTTASTSSSASTTQHGTTTGSTPTTGDTASATGGANTSFASGRLLSGTSLLAVWAVFGAATGILMALL